MLRVRVQQIRYESDSIVSVQLFPIATKILPSFNSGAHIDVHLPNKKVRQYSLISPLQDRTYYEIAILKDKNSKGGSKYFHENLRVGNILTISEPRNLFELDDTDSKILLFAGGIGITPILSMWSSLSLDKRKCELHYCTRDFTVPFLSRIQEFGKSNPESDFSIYQGNKDNNGFDIEKVLKTYPQNTHIYICGSLGFIYDIEKFAETLGWKREFIHKECFKNSTIPENLDNTQTQIIEIASTGQQIKIKQGDNIAKALIGAGHNIKMSCEQGLCGTCATRYIEGEFHHQDIILNESERKIMFTPCCSIIKSKKIIIDI